MEGTVFIHYSNPNDTIIFLLQNLFEMNRLWIRMQQISPKDKNRHRTDRKELSVLVGENIFRLSSLESVDIEIYKTLVLPRLLALVHNCKDVYSQQYFMDSVIQVFPYEYHIKTVDIILEACSGLHNLVDTGAIFIILMERLSDFFNLSKEIIEINKEVDVFSASIQFIDKIVKEQYEIVALGKLMDLEIALIKVCVKCYPDKIEHIEVVLDRSLNLVKKHPKAEEVANALPKIAELLAIPLDSLTLVVIAMPSFSVLAEYLNTELKESLAQNLLKGLIKSRKKVESLEVVGKIVDYIKPLLENYSNKLYDKYELENIQIHISKLMHIMDLGGCEKEFAGLMKLNDIFTKSKLSLVEIAIPSLIWALYRLASKASNAAIENQALQIDVFEKAYDLCETLGKKRSEEALKLLLQGVNSLSLLKVEGEIGTKLMSKVLSLYKDNAKLLTLIIGSLKQAQIFPKERNVEYFKIIIKLCNNLKNKEEQGKIFLQCTHLVAAQENVSFN